MLNVLSHVCKVYYTDRVRSMKILQQFSLFGANKKEKHGVVYIIILSVVSRLRCHGSAPIFLASEFGRQSLLPAQRGEKEKSSNITVFLIKEDKRDERIFLSWYLRKKEKQGE